MVRSESSESQPPEEIAQEDFPINWEPEPSDEQLEAARHLAVASTTPPVFRLKAPDGKTPNLLQRINSIIAEAQPVAKLGDTGKYSYARVDDIVAAVNKLMAKHGVTIFYNPLRREHWQEEEVDSGGRPRTYRVWDVTTRVYVFNSDDPEECAEFTMSGLCTNYEDKGDWVMQSMLEKYALGVLFKLQRGGEGDAEAHDAPSGERARQQPRGKPPTTQRAKTATERAPKTWEAAWQMIQKAYPEKKGNIKPITDPQIKRLFAIAREKGWAGDQVETVIRDQLNGTPVTEVLWPVYNMIVYAFRTWPPEEGPPANLDEAAQPEPPPEEDESQEPAQQDDDLPF